jgi:hypothetical protein
VALSENLNFIFYIIFSTKPFLFCTGLYTPGFEIDFSTEFLMGHSSGAHITTNYMKLGCHNIKGMILISPVDGVDPFGLIEDFCITPGEKLPFTTPTLIITAGKVIIEKSRGRCPYWSKTQLKMFLSLQYY